MARIYSRGFKVIEGITFMIERKDVQRLSMRYSERVGGIAVSIPLSYPQEDVDTFIFSNLDWARKVLAKIEKREEKRQELTREDYLEWWKKTIEIYNREMDRMGLRGSLHFRSMTSRWGSCIPAKRKITLSTRLVDYPLECTRYVIIHELAHLVYHGHGPEFWDLVERYCPDWRQIRQRLRQ